MEDDTIGFFWPDKNIMGFSMYQAKEDYEVTLFLHLRTLLLGKEIIVAMFGVVKSWEAKD